MSQPNSPTTSKSWTETLNALTSPRTMDDVIAMIPEIHEEVKKIDPTGTIEKMLLIGVALKTPLTETEQKDYIEGLKAINNALSNTPRMSRKLNFVLDTYATHIRAIIDNNTLLLAKQKTRERVGTI